MTQSKKFKPRQFGPLHTYKGMKRDFFILVGLIVILAIIKAVSG